MSWVWYTADCEPPLTMPFRKEAERDSWVVAHQDGTAWTGDNHYVIKGGHD